MSVTGSTTEEIFPGTGGQTAFVYTQNTDVAENVHVAILDPSGTPTDLTNVTHYDLANVGGAGGITVTYPRTSVTPISPFDVTLLSTENIVIWIDPPRTTDFNPKNLDTYGPAALGVRIDDIYRNMQKIQTDLDRKYGVALGATNPASSSTGPQVVGGKVLLATETLTNQTKITVVSGNWPATYDRVELDLNIVPVTDGADLEIQPIDGGTATTDNLKLQELASLGGSSSSGANASAWKIGVTTGIGSAGDEGLVGSATFYYVNSGYLFGTAQWMYNNSAGVPTISNVAYTRHTTVAVTSWDGFDILMDSGNITGTARLWGIVNS